MKKAPLALWQAGFFLCNLAVLVLKEDDSVKEVFLIPFKVAGKTVEIVPVFGGNISVGGISAHVRAKRYF